MASKPLPTIPQADVASHNTAKSCYVTIGAKVYDITDFLEDHPGGGDLILEYGGKDVRAIMQDQVSHSHSETAYEILDDHLVGFVATDHIIDAVVDSDRPDSIVPLPPTANGVKQLNGSAALNGSATKPVYAATGMSSAEDLSRETDTVADFRENKFLDLSKPLFMQLWRSNWSKEFYLQQVHRPRHYRGGDSAPLFGNFLEPLSKTPWWIIPLFWWPPVVYGTVLAHSHLSNVFETAGYWVFGLFFWTIIEYVLHRGLFHVDK